MRRFARCSISLAVIAWLVSGCASAPPEPTRTEWSAIDLAYLWPPRESDVPLPPDMDAALSEGYGALRAGYPDKARSTAQRLATELEEPSPAVVLAAQVDLLEGRYEAVVDVLTPIVASRPGATGARLALGRAYDKTGRPIDAYQLLAGFETSQSVQATVRQRIAELRPIVIEQLVDRIEKAARESRIDQGKSDLALLETLAPQKIETFHAARVLARAEGDEEAELAALRALAQTDGFDSISRRRLGDLELLVGEPASAMRAYEQLLSEKPGDADLLGALDRAKFQWRLRLLPRPVVELSQLPVLTRGDFAALTYWLVPSVRRGAPLRATIANDILDHAMRNEIVRVVNLDLMDVDPVHRFHPDKPVRSLTVLSTYLEVVARAGGADACTGDGWSKESGADAVCAAAVRCKLLAVAGDCAPYEEVSGARAVQVGRAALQRLGAP